MNEQITLSQAVEKLSASLRSDPELFDGYKANIAMAFKDEYERQAPRLLKHGGRLNPSEVHEIANNAATNFLNLLTTKK